MLRPNPTDETQYQFGLVDEASKLNINTATFDMMMALPNMTSDLAAAIIDWRDADDNIDPNGGAENEFYLGMPEPYYCKNDTFETPEEILLVKGSTTDLLFGVDANHNGVVDANEDAAGASSTLNSINGQSRCGIMKYLTVYSRDSNVSASGKARLNVNTATQQQIERLITSALGKGKGSGQAVTINLRRKPFLNIFDFYYKTGMQLADFKLIADLITTNTAKVIPGLININTAPKEVLMCLPGLAEGDADSLIAARPTGGTTSATSTASGFSTCCRRTKWCRWALTSPRRTSRVFVRHRGRRPGDGRSCAASNASGTSAGPRPHFFITGIFRNWAGRWIRRSSTAWAQGPGRGAVQHVGLRFDRGRQHRQFRVEHAQIRRFLEMARRILCCEIGAASLTLAEVELRGSERQVVRSGEFAIDPAEGFKQAAKTGLGLRDFLKKSGFSARQVFAGLPTPWLMLKDKTVPRINAENLAGLLRMQAERDFSLQPDELVLDYALGIERRRSRTGRAAGGDDAWKRFDQLALIFKTAGLNLRVVGSTTLALAIALNRQPLLVLTARGADLVVRTRGGVLRPLVLSAQPLGAKCAAATGGRCAAGAGLAWRVGRGRAGAVVERRRAESRAPRRIANRAGRRRAGSARLRFARGPRTLAHAPALAGALALSFLTEGKLPERAGISRPPNWPNPRPAACSSSPG